MFLVERVATDAPLLSHHHHMKIVFPLKLLWAVRKGGNQMALNPDCKLGVPHFNFLRVSSVWAAVWGQVSCNNKISFDSFPLLLERIAGLISLWSMSQYVALVTVVPRSWEVSRIGPWESQKTVNINFPADGCVLNFFATGDDGCFHCILCCLLSGS